MYPSPRSRGEWNFSILAQPSARKSKRGATAATMQDLASLLSDILTYMTAGWRSRSRSVRWVVRVVMVMLVVGLVWVIWQM